MESCVTPPSRGLRWRRRPVAAAGWFLLGCVPETGAVSSPHSTCSRLASAITPRLAAGGGDGRGRQRLSAELLRKRGPEPAGPGACVSRNLIMRILIISLVAALGAAAVSGEAAAKRQRLFDGKSFAGWEGDTTRTWRVRQGGLVGGSLLETVPHNEFLCTTRPYLELRPPAQGQAGRDRLRERRGPVPQPPRGEPALRSERLPGGHGGGVLGSLSPESRRNRTLVKPDEALIRRVLKAGDWNEYEIRCEGTRIRIRLNGEQTVDYTETDAAIPDSGIIGVQIHGGGKAEASYKEMTIEELP